MAFSTGYIQDLPDDRDKSASELLAGVLELAVEASLSQYVIRVLNQGNIGSCVANAGFQAVRMSQVRQMKAKGIENPSPPLGARLFGFYNAHSYHDATASSGGTYIRYFFKALNKFGFCPESEWPYDTTRYAETPDHHVYRSAFDQKDPTDYYRITSTGDDRITDIKKAVSLGHPVVFGTLVSKDFTMSVGIKDIIKPPIDIPHAGGHAMVVEGYDASSFTILNSWGDGFGNRGRIKFAPEYITWGSTTDLWVVRSAPSYSDISEAA